MKKVLSLILSVLFIIGAFSVTVFAANDADVSSHSAAAGSHVHSFTSGVINENANKTMSQASSTSSIFETLDLNVSTTLNSQGQIVVTIATPTTLSTSLKVAEGMVDISYVPSFMTFNGISGSFLGKVITDANYDLSSGGIEIFVESQSANIYGLATRITLTFNPVGNYSTASRSSISISGQAKTSSVGGAVTTYFMSETREFAYCAHVTTKEVVSIPATCSKEGVSTTYCQVCGLAIKESYISKTDHTYPTVPARVITPATCTASGLGEYVCTVCHQTGNSIIPPTGHTYGAPYAGNDGHFYVKCSVCNNITLSDKQCNHPDSAYVLVSVVREATCTVKGSAMYKCSTCGSTMTKEIPLKEHSWETISIITEATETQAGLKQERCSVCNLIENHEYVYHVTHVFQGREEVVKAATCTEPGTKKVYCTGCNEFITETIPATGHSWSEWNILQAGNCTTDELRERTCIICAASQPDKIEAPGHAWTEWTIEKQPTCQSAGSKNRTCTRCQQRDVAEIEKLPHTYPESEYVTIKVPTCSSEGIAQCICSVCKEAVNQKSIAINPNNHDFAEWVTDINPDCLNSGLKSRTCRLCNKVETEVLPSAGHVFAGEITNNGVTTKTCSVCGSVQTTTFKNNMIAKKTVSSSYFTLTFNQGTPLVGDVFFYAVQLTDTEFQTSIKPYENGLAAVGQKIASAFDLSLKLDGQSRSISASNIVEINLPADLESVDVRVWYLKADGSLAPIDAKMMKRTKNRITIEIKDGLFDNANGKIILTNAGKRSSGAALPITIAVVTVVVIAGLVIFLRSRDTKHKSDSSDDDDFYTDTEISTKKTKKASADEDDDF